MSDDFRVGIKVGPTFRWQLVVGVALFLVLWGLAAIEAHSESDKIAFRTLDGLFEPSGVGQLNDGRLVVVEDEPSRPFALLTPLGDTGAFRAETLRLRSLLDAASGRGRVGDLEGIAVGPGDFVYAITSHSRKSNGKRDQEREKLIRFKVDGDRLFELTVRGDLRDSLTDAFPALDAAAKERKVKRKGGLNIEGFAFDQQKESLWIGFRSPLVDEKAILVAITNPHGALERGEKFAFTEAPLLLDLDRGGVRDIVYAPRLGGYLILSQREGTKKEKAFKLWLWSGDPAVKPRRVRIEGVKDLARAEGVAPVRVGGEDKILLISDDGDRARQQHASYLLADYDLLRIEPDAS